MDEAHQEPSCQLESKALRYRRKPEQSSKREPFFKKRGGMLLLAKGINFLRPRRQEQLDMNNIWGFINLLFKRRSM
jgi:hypothetical protein